MSTKYLQKEWLIHFKWPRLHITKVLSNNCMWKLFLYWLFSVWYINSYHICFYEASNIFRCSVQTKILETLCCCGDPNKEDQERYNDLLRQISNQKESKQQKKRCWMFLTKNIASRSVATTFQNFLSTMASSSKLKFLCSSCKKSQRT